MKEFFTQKVSGATVAVSLGFALIVGFSAYSVFSYRSTLRDLRTVAQELSLVKADMESKIASLDTAIGDLRIKNDIIAETIITEQRRTSSVASAIGGITSTVSLLEKLSKTDPELLKKYSKVYFLNEHYVPLSLATIEPSYISNESDKNLQIHSSAYPYLKKLLESASAEGKALRVQSAFRSFGTQAVLKSTYRVTYGAGTANQFSAEQGYSEHQLGTTVDFSTALLKGSLAGFDSTPEYAWLSANAHKYGFILSYPKGNTHYTYEPWHWRFVGVALATKLHNDGVHFYDTDQRVIDEFQATIFD